VSREHADAPPNDADADAHAAGQDDQPKVLYKRTTARATNAEAYLKRWAAMSEEQKAADKAENDAEARRWADYRRREAAYLAQEVERDRRAREAEEQDGDETEGGELEMYSPAVASPVPLGPLIRKRKASDGSLWQMEPMAKKRRPNPPSIQVDEDAQLTQT